MHRKLFVSLFGLLLSQTLIAQAPSSIDKQDFEHLCQQIYIDNPSQYLFSTAVFDKNERLLICGADESPGWENVPQHQGIRQLQVFLESKGYFDSEIIRKESKVYVKIGEQSHIQELQFLNPPPAFFDSTFLGADGNTLTPSSLNKIEGWSEARLKNLGHPCPIVESKASAESGLVKVNLKPGPIYMINDVKLEGADGLDPRALTRFYAFEIGDRYNGMLTTLTSRRVMSSGLADYASFQYSCSKDQTLPAPMKQEIHQGQSRNVVVVIGASTQEFPILKLQWNLFKLDPMASQNRAQLHLSNREQSLENDFQWYLFPSLPRLSLAPKVKLNRFSEDFFESFRQSYEVGLNLTHDDSQKHISMEVAPAFNQEETISGDGPEATNFFSLEARATVMSHFFEFYQTSPRSGYTLTGSWWTRKKGLGSSVNGDRFEVSGTGLLNWGGFDPPLLVLGARFRSEWLQSPSLSDAPPSMRLYLGGDRDVRGFNRKSINNGGLGFNRLLYLGLEARIVHWLRYKIQPLVFVDGASAQAEGTAFDELIFWSPGAGIRWGSPFGAIRFTLAYGMIEGDTTKQIPKVSEQWTYFLSFGREF